MRIAWSITMVAVAAIGIGISTVMLLWQRPHALLLLLLNAICLVLNGLVLRYEIRQALAALQTKSEHQP